MKPDIILFLGPSGTGKSTLIKFLYQKFPEMYNYPDPFTTRPLRSNEIDKVQLSLLLFMYKFLKREIILINYLYGQWYGLSKSRVSQIIKSKKAVLLDWPASRLKKILEKFREYNLKVIYIYPTDETKFFERFMKNRGAYKNISKLELIDKIKQELLDYSTNIDLIFKNNEGIEKSGLLLHKSIRGLFFGE